MVSNRLVVSVTKKSRDEIKYQQAVGGLATGLGAIHKLYNMLWVGWAGIAAEKVRGREREIRDAMLKWNLYPIFLSKKHVENYYQGFCNKTIWPLFHYFPQYTVYSENYWKSYKKVNEIFCKELTEILDEGDTVWIHDFHFLLLPKMLREKIPNLNIGFFLHIPFPSYEIFRMLPWRREIVEGMLGADLIGFHTYNYVRHFLSAVRHILGYEPSMGRILVNNRPVLVDAFPIGINYGHIESYVKRKSVESKVQEIKKSVGDKKIMFSIDRLDYTKGIVERLEAFDRFLEKYPEFRKKIVFINVVVPSRTSVEQYRELKRRVDEMVGRINSKYRDIDWAPLIYIYRFLPQTTLIALYRAADIGLILPLRDGMNMIAKEYVASKTDGKGVLILSEMAGAAEELVEALRVNPFDTDEVADSIKEALTMPENEKIRRMRVMQRGIRDYDIFRWAQDFFYKLDEIKREQEEFMGNVIDEGDIRKIISAYKKAKKRIIFLDYDGTLVPFAPTPSEAKPDREIRNIIRKLSSDPKNTVVIVSGREKKDLDKWFSKYSVGMVAEHGVWIKEVGKDWRLVEEINNSWKNVVRPILEYYTRRTPGSLIEEKEYTIAWHYRRCESVLGEVRARELKEVLLQITANTPLGIVEGKKVIEIRHVGINKGRAAREFLSRKKWDFVMAIGDDHTDEDLYDAMPPEAYTIKVGYGQTRAKYNIKDVSNVRKLLKELIKVSSAK